MRPRFLGLGLPIIIIEACLSPTNMITRVSADVEMRGLRAAIISDYLNAPRWVIGYDRAPCHKTYWASYA